MRYLIHSCKKRYWYVKNYLIPSMIEQGIDLYNISVYLDNEDDGCLESCMKSFLSVHNDNNSTWHLQDDILICSDFAERTLKYDIADIICGYCYELDGNKDKIGYVKSKDMWYSFPCIKIPNKIARQCAGWFYNKVIKDGAYRLYVKSKKHDDTLFHIFMEDYYPDAVVLNTTINLVDHVDYLMGGSIANKIRPEKETHAAYFEDKYLVKKLEEKLNYVR